MAGFIKVDVEKFPTQSLNMPVNKELFYHFKVKCKQRGFPLNVVVETFMNQYAHGRYPLDAENIVKWKNNDGEMETLNSTFNKEIYNNFKNVVKSNGYFIRHIVAAFIEDYVNNDLVMEYVTDKKAE